MTGADVKPTCERRRRPNYWKADYSAIKSDLRKFDWEKALKNNDVSEMCEIFRDTVTSLCEKHVPFIGNHLRKQKPVG